MSRPPVSVVMPFAGDRAAAREAAAALLALRTEPADELILADNSGTASADSGVTVVRASSERSPAHARNVGAEQAQNQWLLFLDADCVAPVGLLDAYFSAPIADHVGALAGEVVPAGEGETLAGRYGAARSFLGQQAHLEHPFRPRAVAANLLVRRAAFEQVGGFYEGVRAAEDTDFSWRLQQAGWGLELRPAARVGHRYRATVGELRRQWRGYAAGRAWLARRYQGFRPEPALRRALRRTWRRLRGGADGLGRPSSDSHLNRGRYLLLDALLSADELAGLALSNRSPRPRREAAQVVLVADRFPRLHDPLVEFARALDGARVEAVARPQAPDMRVTRELEVVYREDDGAAARAIALAVLALRHPLRCLADLLRRRPGEPKLGALAPAVRRLERDERAPVHALGGEEVRATARRITRLAGRPLDEAPRGAVALDHAGEHAARR